MIRCLSRALPVALALAFTAPAAAQIGAPASETALAEAVAAYVQPSNTARLAVLTGQLEAAGLDYAVERFEGGNDQTGPMAGSNVVVVLGEGEREILLTAHYDAVVLPDGSMAHGVVDNAASVVAVIEAARMLRDRPLNHRVRLILFDQEELGLIGARRWIEAHGVETVAAVVNADVGAYGDTLMYGLNNGEASAFVVRAVRETCAERAMSCIGFPVYPPSDDRAFIAAGAPVVSLGFQDQIGAHQMWLAFNGEEDSGLREGFVPTVFQRIHSADDVMAHVEPQAVRRAADYHVALLERLDAALAAAEAGVD